MGAIMRINAVLGLLVVLLSPTCQTLAQDRPKGNLATEAREILKTACYRCHGADGTVEGGFSYVLERNQLVSRKQVTPGSATKSKLMRRIVSDEMPPEGETPRLTKEQIATLSKWIDSGAADFNPPKATRTFIAAADMVQAMVVDLKKQDQADRKYTRYLTLTHLYNAGRSDDELQSFQHGITKLVNSLSWGRKVIAPAPVGSPRLCCGSTSGTTSGRPPSGTSWPGPIRLP